MCNGQCKTINLRTAAQYSYSDQMLEYKSWRKEQGWHINQSWLLKADFHI